LFDIVERRFTKHKPGSGGRSRGDDRIRVNGAAERAAGRVETGRRDGAAPGLRSEATVESVRTVPHISYARSADGVSLAFTVAGNGPALVFVPWVPFSNLRMEWQNPLLLRVFEQLSRRLTVIHYDGRGTGHSQRDVADLSLGAMVSDLEAVVDQVGAAQVSLLGRYNSCPPPGRTPPCRRSSSCARRRPTSRRDKRPGACDQPENTSSRDAAVAARSPQLSSWPRSVQDSTRSRT
jgi:hypothetical protein